ncbi:S8 family serine peptidase [Paracoccus sp. CPCC 101403]|uniref:S8 family serine peptidase n=1 Tax=Paracoccus broussonetiae TaxID=3075834 RepID=A0ABU3ECR8_9RHOB|nr:S8 family serine peptidase [Paracoccus sp. CPCC 101403]MDT1062013.1 S8 family serine peptidase [Paracoccus sp. CPCC 101403]
MARKTRKYVVLPQDNVFNGRMETTSFRLFQTMHRHLFRGDGAAMMAASLPTGTRDGQQPPTRPPQRILDTDAGPIRLIDSIGVDEASLVSMTPEQAFVLQRAYPGLRVRPELRLYPLRLGQLDLVRKQAKPAAFRTAKSLALRCVDAESGKPVAEADIVVLLDPKKGFGISGVRTDAEGWFRTALPAAQDRIAAIICSPHAGYWQGGAENVAIDAAGETSVMIHVPPIREGFQDALSRMVKPSRDDDGHGVRVAIIDAGVDPVPDLNLAGGLNTTGTEPADEWFDNGSGHGTHVAGIVARIAPAAQLHAYRVFERGEGGASEFAIARAIRQAVDDGCDIINLSLGQPLEPIAITREARRARAMGAVCIAASGNDYMSAVSYPARSSAVMAVSAGGVIGSWPEGAITGRNVAARPAPIGERFFASFSNIGPELDFIGPGVGIISWVNARAKGVMDGTSMASPAIAGLFARLLSRNPALVAAARNQQRSDDIIRMANEHAKPVGFGKEYEGSGLIG